MVWRRPGPKAAAEAAEAEEAAAKAAEATANRQSAYDLLYSEFSKYGLGSLVERLKGLIQENISPSEFSIRLQGMPEYQQRFSANQDRIAKGLSALTPAECKWKFPSLVFLFQTACASPSFVVPDFSGQADPFLLHYM